MFSVVGFLEAKNKRCARGCCGMRVLSCRCCSVRACDPL